MRLSRHPLWIVLHGCVSLCVERPLHFLTSVVVSVGSCTRSSPLDILLQQHLISCYSAYLIEVLGRGITLWWLDCLKHVLKIIQFESFLIVRLCWRDIWHLVCHRRHSLMTLKLLWCYPLPWLWGRKINILASQSRDWTGLICSIRCSAFDWNGWLSDEFVTWLVKILDWLRIGCLLWGSYLGLLLVQDLNIVVLLGVISLLGIHINLLLVAIENLEEMLLLLHQVQVVYWVEDGLLR